MAPAEANPQTAGQTENQLVTFFLGAEEFGFDIMSVQEIIRQPVLSRIPMAPEYVEGIANLRGVVLPVIDTRSRFGMKREADTDSTRVLVLDVDGVKTGLRVDCVRQVTRIQSTDIEPPPAVIRNGMSSDYLKGVVKLEGGKRIIMSLNPGAISKVEIGDGARDALQADRADLGRDAAAGNHVASAEQSVAQVVSFKLGEEEFAFPMERVREILRVQRPSEVPDTPEHFLGILTVRGVILPVIDLRILLGLRALAADVQDRAEQVRCSYDGWVVALAAHMADSSAPDPGIAGAESLRAWIAEFNTSSQTLMETLSSVRIANDNVIRGWQQLREQAGPAGAKAHFDKSIGPFAHEALRRLTVFVEQITESIREDQRLVVVQTDGALLALLVDKVREVLSVPTSLIDPPPRLGKVDRTEIRGVARLNDGKRLIMLLDADHLVEAQLLDAVGRAGGGGVDGHAEHSNDPGRASGRGATTEERQFVTFRLDDGEYGIPINEIQEIDRSSKMTRIPKSAAYVDGVTNLRGEVIPVINARKRFNLKMKDADERTRVIIIDVDGNKTGLLVDSVREVLNLGLNDIAPPPASISSGVEQRYISGIGKVDGGKRMIVLLNVARVVNGDG
jgi:chemotaxis signal transduction protein